MTMVFRDQACREEEKDRRESGRSVDMNTDDAIHLQSVFERHLLVALATALRSFFEPRNQLVEMRGSL